MRDSKPDDPTGDNFQVPAGYSYLGQFIAHDLTFDPSPLQEGVVDAAAVTNLRAPRFDLQCLYGDGPGAQPDLYRCNDRELFKVGKTSERPGQGDPSIPTELPFDLPRSARGLATIGDPRNDEHLIISQLHLAFLRFHNRVVAELRRGKIPQESLPRRTPFEQAKALVTRHYQWIALNDFLPRIIDQEQLNAARARLEFYSHAGAPFIPVEFSVAAYRFGHSMVRDSYDYNRVHRPNSAQPATMERLYERRNPPSSGQKGLIPSDWIIDWRRFFPFSGVVQVNPSRRVNARMVGFLHDLPGMPPPTSLVVRHLLRGRSLGLPSGQSVARLMGFEPLTPEELATGPDGAVAAKHRFHTESPLWYYALKEAEMRGKGKRLGPMGSRIIAEVFVGLLAADPDAFLKQDPGWKPILPAKQPRMFTMTDLLNYTGDINPIGDKPASSPL